MILTIVCLAALFWLTSMVAFVPVVMLFNLSLKYWSKYDTLIELVTLLTSVTWVVLVYSVYFGLTIKYLAENF